VLTVALEDSGGVLAALQADVVARLADALPWQPEARPYRPHVTVARVRREWRPRTGELPAGPRATFTADAVVLFRSHLGGRGPARYEALERAELAAG
jgi:2'-5' RNA ligase